MAEVSETLAHPVLGKLTWDPLPSLSTDINLPRAAGWTCSFEPYPCERYAFLEQAAELFRSALDNQRRVFREALRAYVLELYNEGWRQADEPACRRTRSPPGWSGNC